MLTECLGLGKYKQEKSVNILYFYSLKSLPLHVNDDDMEIKAVAKWRLKNGK